MSFSFSLNHFNYKERNVPIPLIYHNRYSESYDKDFYKALLFFLIPHKHPAKREKIMNLVLTKL